MSLVSEALRKARARAADGAAATPTVPPTLVLPPRRYRPGIGVVPLALVAVAAAVGGAAGVWWAVGRQRPEPSAPAVAAADRSAAASVPPARTDGAATVRSAGTPTGSPADGAVPGDSAAAPARDGASGEPPRRAAVPAPGADDNATAVTPEHARAATPAATRPHAPAAGAPPGVRGADGRIAHDVLIDADLGYAKLHLDYLVYRPGSPFGRVNGQDVIVGSTVAGFRVDEITADHIKLSDRRNVVVLRVR